MQNKPKTPIYLDYVASTPVSPQVLEAMQDVLANSFANPHAVQHALGQEANAIVEEGRKSVANFLKVNSSEIIFTSGATEANNIAIQGVMKNAVIKNKKHLITSSIEHASVLNICKQLENDGLEVTYLSVDKQGIINLDELKSAIKDTTALVSIIAVNNEIGSIQPLKEISKICREAKVLFHTDATQFPFKIPLANYNNAPFGADLLTLSAHKMYGASGIGALYIRRQSRINLTPLMQGGGQEKGLRSGTVPVHLVAGFAKACERKYQQAEVDKIAELNKIVRKKLEQGLDNIIFLSSDNTYKCAPHKFEPHKCEPHKCVPHILNIYIENIELSELSEALQNEVCVSFGSACTSGRYATSPTLEALGYSNNSKQLNSVAMRVSFSHLTTLEEVEAASDKIIEAVNISRR